MFWSVFCDFDGTIDKIDSIDEVLKTFASPKWKDIEQLQFDGKITARDSMRGQVELIRASLQELDEFTKKVEIDSGFIDFVSFCKKSGVPFTVVSDGVDYIIKRILFNKGLKDISVFANRLVPISENSYTLEAPYMSYNCDAGTCKCAVARSKNVSSCLYIGDGRSDFCISSNVADFVIAKSHLLTHCQKENIPHTQFAGFAKAKQILANLINSSESDKIAV